MNTLNFNNNKSIILFFGMFLILAINLLLDISLFISKILSVYIFNNLYMIPYLFLSFVLIIFFFEMKFLTTRSNYFTALNFKKITFIIFILYFLSYVITYLEGNLILPYVAENYSKEDDFFFHMSFRYPKATFFVHNILLIILSLFLISRKPK